MNINIICDEADNGWIYSEFIKQIKRYSKHTILVNARNKNTYDVVHWLPYYLQKPTNKPSTCWSSHQEAKNPLKSKFISAAKGVSVAISHSKKYADILKQNEVKNVKQIIPGVDLVEYKMRDAHRKETTEKLIVGYSGRTYQSSNRKNPGLLKQIGKLPFVDFRPTDGKIEQKNMPEFYANCDIIVQPSLIEGGSLAIQESLAVGVPILCFKSVGVADEFSHGVIKVPFNNSKDFLSRLEIIWKTKSYLTWREAGRMNLMRKQVKHQTWERFVRLHDIVWRSL